MLVSLGGAAPVWALSGVLALCGFAAPMSTRLLHLAGDADTEAVALYEQRLQAVRERIDALTATARRLERHLAYHPLREGVEA